MVTFYPGLQSHGFFQSFVEHNWLVPTRERLQKMKLLGGDEVGARPPWATYAADHAKQMADLYERRKREREEAAEANAV